MNGHAQNSIKWHLKCAQIHTSYIHFKSCILKELRESMNYFIHFSKTAARNSGKSEKNYYIILLTTRKLFTLCEYMYRQSNIIVMIIVFSIPLKFVCFLVWIQCINGYFWEGGRRRENQTVSDLVCIKDLTKNVSSFCQYLFELLYACKLILLRYKKANP